MNPILKTIMVVLLSLAWVWVICFLTRGERAARPGRVFNATWLKKLLPQRRRDAAELKAEERRRLFQGVNEQDPCLRAMTDLLEEKLLGNFEQACDPRRPDAERLRAIDRAGDAYYTLETIEAERRKEG